MSPLRQSAKLLRTFPEWFIAHRLERVESLPAFLTRIFVGWHEQCSCAPSFQERRWEVCIKQVTIQPGLIPGLTMPAQTHPCEIRRHECQWEGDHQERRRTMTAEKILTKHPLGKTGRNIDRKKYDALEKAILSALRTDDLTHTELFSRLNKHLKGKFSGNISWYGETVKLDLEARKIIERTASKPQRYRLKSR